MFILAKVMIRGLLSSSALQSVSNSDTSVSFPELIHSTFSTSFDSTFLRINQPPVALEISPIQETSTGILISNLKLAQELLRTERNSVQPISSNPIASSSLAAVSNSEPSYPFIDFNLAPYTSKNLNAATALPTVTPRPVQTYLKGRSG